MKIVERIITWYYTKDREYPPLTYQYEDAVVISVKKLIPEWAEGQAFGSTIFVVEGVVHSEELLLHEYEHTLQWRKYGFWGFVSRYYWSYLKNRLKGMNNKEAYGNITLELEAKAAASR